MGTIDAIKDAISLANKVGNHELHRQLVELLDEVHSLRHEQRQLIDEKRELEEAAALRDSLEFRGNAYWRGDEGPFCSKCWDADSKLVRCHTRRGYRPFCPACNTPVRDPEAEPAKPLRPGTASSWLGS